MFVYIPKKRDSHFKGLIPPIQDASKAKSLFLYIRQTFFRTNSLNITLAQFYDLEVFHKSRDYITSMSELCTSPLLRNRSYQTFNSVAPQLVSYFKEICRQQKFVTKFKTNFSSEQTSLRFFLWQFWWNLLAPRDSCRNLNNKCSRIYRSGDIWFSWF